MNYQVRDITKGRQVNVRNPRTGEFDYSFVAPEADEIQAICASLKAAQEKWGASPLQFRVDVLLAWADEIERHAEAIGAAEFIDTGRHRRSFHIPFYVVNAIRTWCKRAPQVMQSAFRSGPTSGINPNISFETQLVPFGLLGVISPWNQPFLLSTMDAIPALLAGCAAIIKPSEVTPRFIEPVMETVRAVPELAKVLRYVPGDGAVGQAMLQHVDIQCFTGSIVTGRKVIETCSQRLVPTFLELGGKDALIVTENADLEKAATIITRASVFQTGQVCYATERVYVHESVHDALVEKLVEKANEIRYAYPDPKQGELNPFIFEKQAPVVDAHIDDALAKGAKLVAGGKSVVLGGGHYMPASVMIDVTQDMKIMRDETFGPVTPVMRYRTADEAVSLANDTHYGLSGAVLAGDIDEARSIGVRLQAGAVSLQDAAITEAILLDAEKMQFKQSGIGTSRMGPNALLRFFRRKVLLQNAAPPLSLFDISEQGTAKP